MPIYEYECKKCGHSFQKLESFGASSRKTCPECGGTARRVFSTGVGFVFKGSGFYATDYAKKEAKTSEVSVPAKTDEKPEKKKD